jgi:signal transduction histidine kinase
MGSEEVSVSPGEAARLQLLERLGVMDTPAEREFDDIVFMASMVCGCPMASIAFVDSDRLWNKSRIGPLKEEVPRDLALGGYAITVDKPTIIADTRVDPRVNHIHHENIRLYAGFPLRTNLDSTISHAVGVLNVMDDRPRVLNPAQLEALAALARQAERLLELRVAVRDANAEREKVALSEERFRLAIAGLSQGVIVVSRDGIVLTANPAASAIVNATVDRLVGFDMSKHLWSTGTTDDNFKPTLRFSDSDGEPIDHRDLPVFKALTSGLPATSPVLRVTLPDGRHRWLSASATPFRDPRTRERCAVAAFLDVTDEYNLEVQLRDSMARLTAASRERAALISAVAHDLRAPVASIRLMADLLEDPKGALTEDRRRDLLARLRVEAATTESALGDLVAADRLAGGLLAPQRSLVDVRALVRRRVDLVVSETHRLDVRLPEEDLLLWADRAQLERVVDNLIGNALKHTPPGSRVSVAAEDRHDVIAIVCDDDGPGVAAELYDTIFDAYVRGTDAVNRPGSGVGLYLVAQFARFHGGRARCAKSPLGGAQFTVTLAKSSGLPDEPAGVS